MTRKQQAQAHLDEILRLTDALRAKARASFTAAVETENWGHVGDLAHLHESLAELAGERG